LAGKPPPVPSGQVGTAGRVAQGPPPPTDPRAARPAPWAGDPRLCHDFTGGLATATPSWSQGHRSRGHISLPGLARSHASPVCSASALGSLLPSEQPCVDPCRDPGCPQDLGRETVPSCLPSSHQNTGTNGHVSTEVRTGDDPRNTVWCPRKAKCPTGHLKRQMSPRCCSGVWDCPRRLMGPF